MKTSVVLSCRLEEELKYDLNQLAKENNTTLSKFLRNLIIARVRGIGNEF